MVAYLFANKRRVEHHALDARALIALTHLRNTHAHCMCSCQILIRAQSHSEWLTFFFLLLLSTINFFRPCSFGTFLSFVEDMLYTSRLVAQQQIPKKKTGKKNKGKKKQKWRGKIIAELCRAVVRFEYAYISHFCGQTRCAFLESPGHGYSSAWYVIRTTVAADTTHTHTQPSTKM